jgi:hypothetical protein
LSEISDNARVRLLGGGPAADKPPQPLTSRTPPQPAPPNDPVPPSAEPIFFSDSADGADLLDAAQTMQPLAQLCVTPQVQTPFLAAIAGPAGAGKSFALRRLAQMVEGMSGSHAKPGGRALGRIIVAQVDAAGGAEPAVAIARAAYAALDRDGSGDNAALIDECAHAVGDPLRAAKAASDRHEEIVGKLEAERAQSDEIEARRSRLGDAVLYDTPGSRVGVFASSRRATIEASLRRFDLAGTDAIASYRDLVRDLSGLGPGARAAIVLRAIWARGGQRRLLIWAIVAFVLAFALQKLNGGEQIDALAGSAKPVGDWIADHRDWIDKAVDVLMVLGALAIALNLWRAISFSSLLFRGSRLLNHDILDRHRDIEARAARLQQRIATLSAEAEAAARTAEAATRRAGGKAGAREPRPDFLEAGQGAATAARAFLAALSERIGRGSSAGVAPDRLVFAVDNLDSLSPDAAIAWIDSAARAIGPGCVGLLALNPARLVDALGGPQPARRRFDKWIQIVVNLPDRSGVSGERLMARLISTAGRAGSPQQADANIAAALVEPFSSAEATLLTALAPLAARSPRGAKQFLNAYRLARCSNSPRPAAALMLAVAFAGDEVQAAMRDRLSSGARELNDVAGPEALVNAVRSARAANNGAISLEDARAAAEVARRYVLSL